MFCNIIVGGAIEAIVFPISECVVPDGLDGPVHLFITSSETPLSSNIVNQTKTPALLWPVGLAGWSVLSKLMRRARCRFH